MRRPDSPHEHTAGDAQALASQLAADIAQRLRAAVADRGRASLVVSGGRTPVPMFEALRTEPLAWERVTVTLADERWVPADAPDSNERLVRAHLLQDAAAAACFVGLTTAAATPEAGRAGVEAALQSVPRPFDVVVLGMGNDGHTASLFPDAPELQAGLTARALCVPAHPPSVPQARISMTLAALLDSREILLHLVGADKRDIYERALAGQEVEDMPVRAVLHQDQVPVHLYWAP